jgi:hypothetical protein
MRNQMSAGQIDTLLDLWAATLIKHDDSPPFVSHRDLYDTIDATPLGDVSWESFSMSFNGVKPAENVPPWMDGTHDVWFRDPRLLIHNMLANPDFDGEIEYTPYRDYNGDNKRCFKNFFSGNWAWNQAVHFFVSVHSSLRLIIRCYAGHYCSRSRGPWINVCSSDHRE